MKKINLLIAAGLLASASMQAQVTTIASVGFESGDQKYTTEYAYTPGGTYGNWVNRQENDVWDEQSQDDVNSGEYAFSMQNDAEVAGAGQTWLRGFTIGGLKLTENTPYRVSFWVKGEPGCQLKSSMNIGYEYCDMNIRTKGGLNYYYCTEEGKGTKLPDLTGEWQKISYVTFFTNKADQDAYADEFADKEDPNGNVPMPKGSVFPEEYNVIINCYNGGNYILDDIKVEAGVTFNQATFNYECIKLDFGYPTNIATLAKEDPNGLILLDPACVSVTVNGESVTPLYVEGHDDGFLYVFMDANAIELKEADVVKVSFTPAADCPIVYNTGMRPSADVETPMTVLGFTDEVALYDESIDALSNEYLPAVLVSTTPEDKSFELESASLNQISVTFSKPVDDASSSATLMWEDNSGAHSQDLNAGISLSEDGKTINVAVSGLADGEYTFLLSGVETAQGTPCDEVKIQFAVGEDKSEGDIETIYESDFDNELTDGVPRGWLTKDASGIHQFGYMDEAQTIQYQYGWGHAARNPNGTEGGARLYEGFSGDFKKALYWCRRNKDDEGNDTPGYTSYGEIVKDWLDPSGNLMENAPEGIALVLEPGQYQLTFVMAAWKGEPTFTYALEDLDGNQYAGGLREYVAKPNCNGNKIAVSGATKVTETFKVDKSGYYVLKFEAQSGEWREYMLGSVKLYTLPSQAALSKKKLVAALEPAKEQLEAADDEAYAGETYNALKAEIEKAEKGGFHSDSEIEAEVAKLNELSKQLATRIENIDNFNQSVEEAQLAYYGEENPNYDPEDETSEQWLTKPIAGTKYENSDIAKEAKALIDAYAEVSPSTLSDETLAEVSPKLVAVASALKGLHSSVDVLTWRAYKAGLVADVLGVTGAARDKMGELVTDDTEAIEELNGLTKLALYEMLAADPVIPEEKKTTVNYSADQQSVVDGEYVQMTGEEVATSGIDFACLVRNPKFYTYATDFNASISDNTVVGWNCEQYEGGSLHLNGAAATAENLVVNCNINAYGGGAEYNFYQVIENAPVGVYDVYIQTRTATKNNVNPDTGVAGVFNAMDDDSGIWDKYIYAQVDDNDPIMVPFSAGGNWGGYPTVVKNVAVGEGQKLTIGVIEHYVSGKASGHDWIDATEEEAGHYKPTDRWDTNTTATDARLYFVAPLENYDYGQAATGIETVEAIKAAKGGATFNVAGQRVDENYKGIVIKADGTKKYQK